MVCICNVRHRTMDKYFNCLRVAIKHLSVVKTVGPGSVIKGWETEIGVSAIDAKRIVGLFKTLLPPRVAYKGDEETLNIYLSALYPRRKCAIFQIHKGFFRSRYYAYMLIQVDKNNKEVMKISYSSEFYTFEVLKNMLPNATNLEVILILHIIRNEYDAGFPIPDCCL